MMAPAMAVGRAMSLDLARLVRDWVMVMAVWVDRVMDIMHFLDLPVLCPIEVLCVLVFDRRLAILILNVSIMVFHVLLIVRVYHFLSQVTVMLAEKMRIYEGVVDWGDVDLVGYLVMSVVLVAMVVIHVGFVGLRVERLPWEVLTKAFHNPMMWHLLVIMIVVAEGRGMDYAGAFRLGFHLEYEVSSFGICVVRMEDA